MLSMVDSIFSSSPAAIGNPNMGFMMNIPFHPYSSLIQKEEGMVGFRALTKKEEEEEEDMFLMMDSSGGGNGEVGATSGGEEQDKDGLGGPQDQITLPETKRKRYHRHTTRQIQEMEALFKECPHPDDKQRQKLSQELGLKPRQVKFWFQNRRTQMKAQHDRAENAILRAQNENLKNENFRLQSTIRNLMCTNCGGPAVPGEVSMEEQQIRLENAQLKEQLERLSYAARYSTGCSVQSLGPTQLLLLPSLDLDMDIYSRHFINPNMGSNSAEIVPVPERHHPLNEVIVTDYHKRMALELAMTAADHLVRLCNMNGPVWIQGNVGGMIMEVLDVEEYGRLFQWPIDLRHNGVEYGTEATRDSAIVILNSITLVDAFLDANKWMELFPSIVSKAKTLQVITPGVHGNGSLHLMYAEFQGLSPLVPTREAHFLRYFQHNLEEKTWTIVDFPIDGFHEGLQMPSPQYRRRPSGCIIEEVVNGYSRVTWVEHAEVADSGVHQVFDQLISSGIAFGATRWLSILQLQCERLASFMSTKTFDLGVHSSVEARKNMMNLSQRMVKTFCANISSSSNQLWTALPDSSDDTMRVISRKNLEPGQHNGVILTAVSTTWLPFSHLQVFELLTVEDQRSQLDLLSNGSSLKEVSHIANGSHQGNCISLLRINPPGNSSQNVEFLLQESSTHPAGGSIVVYANFDIGAVQMAMDCQDTSYIPILPTGFVILPSPMPHNYSSNVMIDSSSPANIGCLLTVGMQSLVSADPTTNITISSITSIKNNIVNAVHKITAALGGCNGNSLQAEIVGAVTTVPSDRA